MPTISEVLDRHRRELLAIPGCTGAAIGKKVVAGRQTDTTCIVVSVRRKGRPLEPGTEVPAQLEGFPTDVIERGAGSGPDDVVLHETDEDHEETLAYWTPERRAAAVPRELTRPRRPRGPVPGPGLQLHPRRPGAAPSGPDTELVPDIQQAPFRSVGKVFFRWQGCDYVGSAWKLASSGIATAGHNVYDEGEWSRSLVFWLRYDEGSSDGTYTTSALASLRGWIDGEDAYDLGGCRTREPIGAGGTAPLAFVYNQPVADVYTALGYPAEPIPRFPFDGERMWQSEGSSCDPVNLGQVAARVNLSKGASGGPWLAQFKGLTVVNGITMGGPEDSDDISFSPYFGQGIKNLYDAVSGW